MRTRGSLADKRGDGGGGESQRGGATRRHAVTHQKFEGFGVRRRGSGGSIQCDSNLLSAFTSLFTWKGRGEKINMR